MRPAKVLIAAGLVAADQLYQVNRALYGLHQSPRDWIITRDAKLKRLTWKLKGEGRCLRQAQTDC